MKKLLTILLLGAAALPQFAWADFAPVMPELRTRGMPVAPQFTFRVPVQLTAMVADTRAFIHCRPLQGSVVQAELQQEVPLDANGNFNGMVSVSGNLAPERDPTLIDRYSCSLRLQGRGASAPQPPCFGESCPNWWKTKPGTPFRPAVEAALR